MNEEPVRAPINDMPQCPEPMTEPAISSGPISARVGAEKEYKRPTTELLREHHIEIRFLSIGCIIRVGCKEIAFTDRDIAMSELMEYVKDPHTATRKWMKRFDQ